MEILYLIIPLSMLLVAGIVWIFLWAIRSGQFDDLEGPAHRILMDDDSPKTPEENGEQGKEKAAADRIRDTTTESSSGSHPR